jgi:hypothetical protein
LYFAPAQQVNFGFFFYIFFYTWQPGYCEGWEGSSESAHVDGVLEPQEHHFRRNAVDVARHKRVDFQLRNKTKKNSQKSAYEV